MLLVTNGTADFESTTYVGTRRYNYETDRTLYHREKGETSEKTIRLRNIRIYQNISLCDYQLTGVGRGLQG